MTNIDEIQLEPIHSVAEQKDSNSSVPNGHQHDDSGSAAEDHYDVEQHFGEVIAAGQEQLLEESVNNSKKESESSQLSPDKGMATHLLILNKSVFILIPFRCGASRISCFYSAHVHQFRSHQRFRSDC